MTAPVPHMKELGYKGRDIKGKKNNQIYIKDTGLKRQRKKR